MKKAIFYIGTYSKPDEESIYLYEADFEKGVFTKIHSHSGTPNPSFLLESSSGIVYAVEELASGGDVSAFAVSEKGFERICRISSFGKDPCHLELNKEEDLLFVSNYSSGSLAAFKLDQKGMFMNLWDLKEHKGKGINPDRQEAPHVHFSMYRDGSILVCDLGLDKVFHYKIDNRAKEIIPTGKNLIFPGGSGPRHLCVHPENKDLLYVAAELTAEVFAFHHTENKGYKLVQSINSLPDGVLPENRIAAIKFSADGRYLFVSNRGNDCLTAFSVENNGFLKVMDVCGTGGKTPRDFSVFGDHIIIANQDSSLLTVMFFNRETGKLERNPMKETVGHPVCVTEKRVS